MEKLESGMGASNEQQLRPGKLELLAKLYSHIIRGSTLLPKQSPSNYGGDCFTLEKAPRVRNDN